MSVSLAANSLMFERLDGLQIELSGQPKGNWTRFIVRAALEWYHENTIYKSLQESCKSLAMGRELLLRQIGQWPLFRFTAQVTFRQSSKRIFDFKNLARTSCQEHRTLAKVEPEFDIVRRPPSFSRWEVFTEASRWTLQEVLTKTHSDW